MKYAIVTFKKKIKIDKSTSDDLKKVFNRYHDFTLNTALAGSEFLYDGKQRLIDEFTKELKSFLTRYCQDLKIDSLKYDEGYVSDLYFIKSEPDSGYIEIEILSTTYTILDTTGNFILLKEGDLRDVLKQNEPIIIADAFFLELTPEIAYKTYIPY